MMKELSILKTENSKLREDNELKNKEIMKLKTENSKLRKDNELRNKEIMKLKTENSKLRKEEEMKIDAKRRLEKENESLQNQLKELKKKISSITKQTNTSSSVGNKSKTQQESILELLGSQEIEQLKIVKKIGQGSQSEVYEVTREQHYALKVLLIADELIELSSKSIVFKTLQRLLQEYEILHL
ncbi:hypothetical protein M9Y10_031506 [Tritrichomonas musculus]|uniref:Protein kinase domain-containing protein n=1 Tax=Tritrichomonas musculus TaxID=1915356 RepID=A0ABR2H0S6_9EUKA